MLYHVQMHKKVISRNSCTAADTTIHYLERDGDPSSNPLLLLHSFASGSFLWCELMKSTEFPGRILGPDLPGNGSSSLPSQEPTIDYHVQFLKQFCEKTTIRNFIGVGVSMGSNILAAFSLKYPEMIQRMILMNPIDDTVSLNPVSKIAAMPKISEIIFKLFPGTLNGLRKRISKNFYDPTRLKQELISAWWNAFETGEVRHWIPKALRARPTTIAWQNIKIPCTVVFGKNDPVVSKEFHSRLRSAFTAAVYIELDQCGHYPHLEFPERIESLILDGS
jgi:4,5:9,10-diseco-3-hydroxy-5,9,17-trioxoandrosta-1(10),2-diene-4-oate hydrolase